MGAMKVDEASLTAVADAIREKSGTSEGLTFPEGFVNAVAGIQAGGDKKIFVTEIAPESAIYNTGCIYLQHGLGEKPNFVIVKRKYAGNTTGTEAAQKSVLMCGMFQIEYEGTSTYYVACCAIKNPSSSVQVYEGTGTCSASSNKVSNCPAPAIYLDENQIGITSAVNNSGVFLEAGVEYRIIAGLY